MNVVHVKVRSHLHVHTNDDTSLVRMVISSFYFLALCSYRWRPNGDRDSYLDVLVVLIVYVQFIFSWCEQSKEYYFGAFPILHRAQKTSCNILSHHSVV